MAGLPVALAEDPLEVALIGLMPALLVLFVGIALFRATRRS